MTKTVESPKNLSAGMEELHRQGEKQGVGFELQMAGVRNIKAARALLADYDDIKKARTIEPGFFGVGASAPTMTGATGLSNAGGATDEGATMRRWRGIAGLLEDKEQPMANNTAYVRDYTSILNEVYKWVACSTCLDSPHHMARAGRNAKEIMVPKIQVSGLGNCTRNVGYKTGSITYEFETKTFNYDRGIKLLADAMNVGETSE